jgi:hexosaminidase
VFYAFQTLRQLLPAEIESRSLTSQVDWVMPAVEIADAPRFPYRGMHLDVGRHFFDIDFVKKYIDTMARFKLNQFHWHLTEDQGWRIQIDAYPKLTEIGAWRAESPVGDNLTPYVGDGVPHGGFYTKDEVREVVAYAAERFVTVTPEIELPGHATAAIAAYPELGCTDEQLEVSTTWAVHESIFCPQEETFEFIETVLSEVVDLFPSKYIHIGADEVPKRQWRRSAVAQEVMRREGLASEEELQGWFIRRVESYLRSQGRRLIGWDEILEGGLAPDATVMSWRGTEGGIEAAQQGHDVIMTPVEHAYFDFYQGAPEDEPLAMNWAGFGSPLETVYAFEPVPDVLTEEEALHILGPQGNVWTEYIATPEHVEYMAYPRAIALAEVAWSPRAARDWSGFVRRLAGVLGHLDVLEVNYRVPDEVPAPRN